MTVLRHVTMFAYIVLSISGMCQWTPYEIGTTGNRSMTTFNGATFVAVYNVGIKKSVNDGASWTNANTGLPIVDGQIRVQSIGHNANTLFCGTETGVYRSTDNGSSWVLANGGLAASATVYVNKIQQFGGVTFIIFSGPISQSSGGVFRTVDNGNSWLQGYSGLSSNMTVHNIAEANGTLYASTSSALMRSTDLGQSWTQVGSTNYAVQAVQAVGERIVALTTFGARYSTDAGETWTNSTNYPVIAPVAGSELIAYDGKYYAITRSASGCYRSLDGGVSWEEYNIGLSAQNTFGQEEFHASGEKLYIVCILDIHSTPGSTVGTPHTSPATMPRPYPTIFQDQFTVDLSGQPSDCEVIVMDASGRPVRRITGAHDGLVRVHRNGLPDGLYQCLLLDPRTNQLRSLGPIIAQ